MRLPDHRLVFVGGLHRSGTTPLVRCLGAHPEVSGFAGTSATEDEGQHLQTVYPPASTYGGPGAFAFDPRAHRTEEHLDTPETTAWRLFREWRRHWDMTKPVLVEKSPPNLLMMRYLQRMFPLAHFVVVVRHPVVVSLATRKWRRWLSTRALLEHWFHAHELVADDARAVHRLHVLRYEDLVRDPDRELGRLAGFLGLAESPPAGLMRPDRSRRYERQWSSPRWEMRHLGRDSRAELARLFERRCRAFGYRMDDLSEVDPDCELLPTSVPIGVTQG